MIAAFLATLLFAVSTIFGYRSSRQIGGAEANLWRVCLAALFLGIWANTFGSGLAGDAFPLFLLSGFLGVGLGDTGYYQALPRLGSRRAVLLVQCVTPPFAALIEWLWLGTRLNLPEICCIVLILTGVAIALAPGDHLKITPRELRLGVAFSLFAAVCGALGTVMSRKAYAVAHAAGQFPDAGTTGYQRVLGGILIPAIILIVVKWRSAHAHGGVFEEKTRQVSREKWRRIWPWVLGNALAGQTLGMSCFQCAIEKTPAAIVTAIVALTPVILLPMTRIVDGEKIGIRSLLGALIAVAGVIGLTFWR
jgi:drug/metabolite transporter (DMT)-like permease